MSKNGKISAEIALCVFSSLTRHFFSHTIFIRVAFFDVGFVFGCCFVSLLMVMLCIPHLYLVGFGWIFGFFFLLDPIIGRIFVLRQNTQWPRNVDEGRKAKFVVKHNQHET